MTDISIKWLLASLADTAWKIERGRIRSRKKTLALANEDPLGKFFFLARNFCYICRLLLCNLARIKRRMKIVIHSKGNPILYVSFRLTLRRIECVTQNCNIKYNVIYNIGVWLHDVKLKVPFIDLYSIWTFASPFRTDALIFMKSGEIWENGILKITFHWIYIHLYVNKILWRKWS